MIAAYRAKQQPAIVQVERARLPDHAHFGRHRCRPAELMAKAGLQGRLVELHRAGRTYYTKDGQMMAMPFNSSTPILFYNKRPLQSGGLRQAGRDLAGTRAAALRHQEQGHLEMRAWSIPATGSGASSRTTAPSRTSPTPPSATASTASTPAYVFNKSRLVGHIERVRSGSTTASCELAGQGINPGSSSSAANARRSSTRPPRMPRSRPASKFNWSATLAAARAGTQAEEQRHRRRRALDPQGP